MSKSTQEEKNKVLAEYLYPDRYWHQPTERSNIICVCGLMVDSIYNPMREHMEIGNPNFYSENSRRALISELEKKVIEEFGDLKYQRVLGNYICDDNKEIKETLKYRLAFALATAPQRADACYELIKEKYGSE